MPVMSSIADKPKNKGAIAKAGKSQSKKDAALIRWHHTIHAYQLGEILEREKTILQECGKSTQALVEQQKLKSSQLTVKKVGRILDCFYPIHKLTPYTLQISIS